MSSTGRLPYIRRSDLECFDGELDSIFIEVNKTILNTISNVVIAAVYRMPDSPIDVLMSVLLISWMSLKENKMIYVMGDLNIDFVKSDACQLIIHLMCFILTMCFQLLLSQSR